RRARTRTRSSFRQGCLAMTRSYLTMYDLSREETLALLKRSGELKRLRGKANHPRPLAGKSVAILLEKASTRTRISFEVGIAELGGTAVTLISKDTQLGRGEPLEDTARMLNGYVHAAVFRTFEHAKVQTLAQHATIPLINGLSDLHRPCQV